MSVKRLTGVPIMSLQTGTAIGITREPIIDPYKLKIVAFYAESGPINTDSDNPLVLYASDIHGFTNAGAVVDSVENIVATDSLPRLQKIIDYDFHVRNIRVVDDRGRHVGRVNDYIVELADYDIEQLYVKPRFFEALNTTNLIIGRKQIIKVEPDKITVKAPTVPRRQTALDDAKQVINQTYDNPFRKNRGVEVSKENH